LSAGELDLLMGAADAVGAVVACGAGLDAVDPSRIPLDGLDATLVGIRRLLSDGPGVAVLTGFPVMRYPTEQNRALWWLLAQVLGRPVSQSYRGDVIGDVADLGTGISGATGRGYTSNAELSFHADAADVTGLFYLRTARSGGINRICSARAVHDEIARRRPDLLALLYQPLPWSWQGNQPAGSAPWYELPVFGRLHDEVSCAYVRTNLLRARHNAGAPPLSDAQREAVELVAAVAAEPGMWVERAFGPGTMFLTNNHRVLHLRTAFEDWPEPERRRHLLRVWLCLPNSPGLPTSFAPFFGDTSPGAVRGGYPSRTGALVFQTLA
jgi:hypothetical protein